MSMIKGERGPTGDHGQTGDEGPRGREGKQGRQSPAVTRSFLLSIAAFVIGLIVIGHDIQKTNKVGSQNKSAIRDLQQTKANVKQLQKSNCTLRIFLATARYARYQASLEESGDKKSVDKLAVKSYSKLIDALDGESYCKIPTRLLLK